MRISVEFRSANNYISPQVCVVRNLHIIQERTNEDLRVDDGSIIHTEYRVHVHLRCGEYQSSVQAQVFPGMDKQMIHGIPWFCEKNPNIDWTQSIVVVKKGQKCMSLPLEEQQDDSLAHHMGIRGAK